MRKSLSTLFFIVFLSLTVFSQTAPETEDEVVKISTNIIQIDVTVTDKKGNPVKDLKPDDFEVYENDKKQKITGFSYVSNQKAIQTGVQNNASGEIRPEQVRRTIALVVDDLSLSFESIYSVRRALKKFVDEQMQTGDLAAIIRTGAGIGALQQFTNDKRRLYAAIEKVEWNPRGTGEIGAFAQIEPINPESEVRNLNADADEEFDVEKQIFQTGVSETDFYNYQENIFTTGTLGALDYIIRGMRRLPGRKSVMFLSDGFRLSTRRERGAVENARIITSLKRLTDLANRASVVIYTTDGRGLQSGAIKAQDNLGGTGIITIESSSPLVTTDRLETLRDTQNGLIFLAKETGGIALINNNDINAGIRTMLADQSYYLIAYEPDDETFDPNKKQFNELKIKVNRKDANVRYRSGFFGVSDEKIARQISNLTAQQQLAKAITSPFTENSVSLRLNTLFGNDKENGSFVRSLVHIDVKDLKFTDEPDGGKKTTFDILAASFGAGGELLDKIGTSYTLNVKKEVYEKFLETGFVYYFAYPIKKPGVYQYRVAVLGSDSKQIGLANQLIEIPDLTDKRLTLSGVMLENLTQKQWQNRLNGKPETEISNPLADTSIRRFKTGTILRYGFEIYNAEFSGTNKPNLSAKIRLLRDGKIILDGKENPVQLDGQTNFQQIAYSGGFGLGDELPAGDYILQIVVTDNSAKEKRNLAAQFVQFEIVK